MVARVDVDGSQPARTWVHELVRGLRRHDDDVARLHAPGLIADRRVHRAFEEDEDLRVSVAVELRSLARARGDEQKREGEAVVAADEIARDDIGGEGSRADALHPLSLPKSIFESVVVVAPSRCDA